MIFCYVHFDIRILNLSPPSPSDPRFPTPHPIMKRYNNDFFLSILLYLGVGKVGPLMKWVQEHSSTHFELPSMPHLNDEQKILYKQQVRERKEDLELKRKEDSRAMEAEDRAQKEMKRKKKNELKRKRAAEEAESNNIEQDRTINNNDDLASKSDIIIKLQETNEIKVSSGTDFKAKNSDDEDKQTTTDREDEKEAKKLNGKGREEEEEKVEKKIEVLSNDEL